jgi:hypothetical protein
MRAHTSDRDVQNLCEIPTSTLTWSAILAGSAAAAAVSLILLLLGVGFGLISVSPWSRDEVSPVTFSVIGAIWLIVMQWFASGLGGYLAGRLRCKWADTPNDEVFFRDTVHGFLTWVIATIFTATFLASTVTSIIGSTTQAAATVTAGAARGVNQATKPNNIGTFTDPNAYFVDILFRSDSINPNATEGDIRGKASRVFMSGRKDGRFSDTDKAYLTQLVVARTGLMQPEAVKRVDDITAQASAAETKLRQEADTARKTAATISIFTALSMLVGAFVAAAAAGLGGKRRDEY